MATRVTYPIQRLVSSPNPATPCEIYWPTGQQQPSHLGYFSIQYKDSLFRYRDLHYKDMTVMRPNCIIRIRQSWDRLIFTMGIPILVSHILYWDSPLVPFHPLKTLHVSIFRCYNSIISGLNSLLLGDTLWCHIPDDISFDDGLLPTQRQAITWTNWWHIINFTQRNKLHWNLRQNNLHSRNCT